MMFCKYKYLSSATQAQVQADILLILTGTTNPASLSASCDTAGTTISNTYDNAGWSSYDTAAHTNGFAVRALQQDGSTYKYMTFEANTSTAWNLRIAEAWNSGTHTGTNVIASGNTTWAMASGGYFYIYATQRAIIIQHVNLALSTFTGFNCALELDNTDATIPAGYPTQFYIFLPASSATSLPSGTACRMKHPTSAGDLTTSSAFAVPIFGAPNTSVLAIPHGTIYRDSSENTCVAFAPLFYGFVSTTSSPTAGYVGKVLGKIRLAPAGYTTPAFEDTIVIGATTYTCLLKGSSSANTVWVPEG